VDPSLLDWKKLTGEENVSVINRLTGKKVHYKVIVQHYSLFQNEGSLVWCGEWYVLNGMCAYGFFSPPLHIADYWKQGPTA
jgi:hypothetical protein